MKRDGPACEIGVGSVASVCRIIIGLVSSPAENPRV